MSLARRAADDEDNEDELGLLWLALLDRMLSMGLVVGGGALLIGPEGGASWCALVASAKVYQQTRDTKRSRCLASRWPTNAPSRRPVNVI